MKREQVLGEAGAGLYVMRDNTSQMDIISQKPLFPILFLIPVMSLGLVCSICCSKLVCQRYSSLSLLSQDCTNKSCATINQNISAHSASDSILHWHKRLGHLPFHSMKSIKVLPITLNDKIDFPCEICPMAR